MLIIDLFESLCLAHIIFSLFYTFSLNMKASPFVIACELQILRRLEPICLCAGFFLLKTRVHPKKINNYNMKFELAI